jgi:glycosyltransferase involved in cell wall biosynthesis
VAHSTCVVIPSHSEGFCFAAAEAVAMGVPIISSGKGALHEVVSGLHLHLSKLDSSNLAAAMKKAIARKWDKKEIVKFEVTDFIQGHLTLYQKIAETN